jgi:transcriptional regulator with XRE-family HTH domain
VRLACRLRELREERGLSIRDVEARKGISRGYLSHLERGRLLPRDEWIDALEAVYEAPDWSSEGELPDELRWLHMALHGERLPWEARPRRE